MQRIAHSLPTTAGTAGDLARQLGRLVGPAVQAPDDSLAAAEYLALGGALALARQATLDAIAEAIPASADDLLPEWEEHLGLPVQPQDTDDDRRARILARLRAAGGTVQRIERSSGTLAGGACVVLEQLWSAVTLVPRMVFRFAIQVPTALHQDVEFRSALDELLQRQAPAHTTWNVLDASAGMFQFDVAGAGFNDGYLV